MIESIKTPGALEYLVGMYAYYLPFVLYMVWAPVSIFDLSKRTDIDQKISMLWTFLILFLPVFGGGIYLLFGGSGIPGSFRKTMVYGGLSVFFVFLILSRILQI